MAIAVARSFRIDLAAERELEGKDQPSVLRLPGREALRLRFTIARAGLAQGLLVTGGALERAAKKASIAAGTYFYK